MWNAITDVPGVLVGQVSDLEAITGCTVLVFPEGAVGGVDLRGSATGTREIDTLSALHVAPRIHAITLAGGSAYGLEAASGVMQALEEQGIGFPTRAAPTLRWVMLRVVSLQPRQWKRATSALVLGPRWGSCLA